MVETDYVSLVLIHLIQRIDAMNAQVTALVAQASTNIATEAKAAAAFAAFTVQVADLTSKLAAATANDFGPDDVAALTKAVSDLSTSATALASATPA